ncbi:hypothetical protein L2E82_22746 [Cichorium intybus]|uniref:Uncharacterized protein n=1 Tax=Cichorium intybus TaxID=13427 RepID=A0ACB9DYW2_CICIN|nr:hypothetical protein L2E82_22746 [Cichorium intybus]
MFSEEGGNDALENDRKEDDVSRIEESVSTLNNDKDFGKQDRDQRRLNEDSFQGEGEIRVSAKGLLNDSMVIGNQNNTNVLNLETTNDAQCLQHHEVLADPSLGFQTQHWPGPVVKARLKRVTPPQ